MRSIRAIVVYDGDMFCAIYRMSVRPGMEQQFETNWASLTELIADHRGALGSRLHRDVSGVYIAYAQWPSRASWEAKGGLPPEADAIRAAMREACESVDTVYELDVVDDRLRDHGAR